MPRPRCDLAHTSGLAALVLTEVNPTHDPGGALLDRYIDAITSALRRPHDRVLPGTAPS